MSWESETHVTRVSLSRLFKKQIRDVDKVDSARIAGMIKRIVSMVDDMDHYSLDVVRMTLRVKMGSLSVVIKALPGDDKVIVQKILR